MIADAKACDFGHMSPAESVGFRPIIGPVEGFAPGGRDDRGDGHPVLIPALGQSVNSCTAGNAANGCFPDRMWNGALATTRGVRFGAGRDLENAG